MSTYDITWEYRADFEGHEIAGHVVAANIIEAAKAIGAEGAGWGAETVEVRFLAEVKRTTCCQRGDWSGADHQPASAFIYVPIVRPRPFWPGETRTYFSPETTTDYRWECEYCGRIGTRAQLDPERKP